MIEKEDYVTPKPGVLIKSRGKFDLDKLYKKGKSWFDFRKYDFGEKNHVEKVKPEGNEISIKWLAERKVNDYIKFHFVTEFFVLYVKKVGSECTGNLKINVAAYLELDYRDKWSKSLIGSFLFYVYNNFIIKRRIEDVYETKLYNEFLEYSGILKETLNFIK